MWFGPNVVQERSRRGAKLLPETDAWGGEKGHSLQLASFRDSLLSLTWYCSNDLAELA